MIGIDRERLKPVLAGYKAYFPAHWQDERYKWEAVQHFQRHWDIEATNFGEMFKEATAKTYNLLASGYAYPRKMILEFAKIDDEAVRQMFRNLFDESHDLAERVAAFQVSAEEIRMAHDDGSWRNHYQNTNAISTYLWLRYPDRYYIYKYEIYRDVANELDTDYRPKRDGSVESMIGGYQMYDVLCEAVKEDGEIADMIAEALDASCYRDLQLKTATIDVGFYLSRFYLDEKMTAEKEKGWFPKEYTPGIDTNKWVELLQDTSVFKSNDLQIMKRMKDYGGQATCTQLAIKYGELKNFYNSGSTALARRVAEKTGCPTLKDEEGHVKWWPILYMAKEAEATDAGAYIWRLRSELAKALDIVDLSDVSLYVNPAPSIWKISEGTDSTKISIADKEIFLSRHVVVVHSTTNAKAVSKISQGQAFMDAIKEGDFFYLCYGNRIQLLGQFISDKPVENPELKKGWYERPYREIAVSQDTSAYDGVKKWWTPNDNSTCIKVPESERALFEQLILTPYFAMTMKDLLNNNGASHAEYTKADFLHDVFMRAEQYDILTVQLRRKLNIIFQGAPGVGKTFAAKRLAYAMMGEKDESRIEMVQFHQNYSYEDFIMGYRPDGTGFKLVEGIFYRFCKKATQDPGKDYFFIIDEINRGNMSKIFGELMMLIEKDYRGTELTLAYNGRPFSVPNNLYIIGMMNTADRSLAMIDYALRRRFSFFTMEPGFDSDGFQNYQKEFANDTFDDLIKEIKCLNQAIAKDASLGRGFRIGHSYFCGCKAKDCTIDWMRSVIEFDIIPMLEEYWFDEPEKLSQWQARLRGVFGD